MIKKNNKKIEDLDEVVDKLNEYFVNVGPNLAKEIELTDISEHIAYVNRNLTSFFRTPVNEKEILKVVRNFNSKNSANCEGLDMTLIKSVINQIVEPIKYICNLSFLNSKFPAKMKTAKVIPIFKSGNKHLFVNYRPISLLPQFSKILEKPFTNRLDSFINKCSLLNDSQYGFRNGRSIESKNKLLCTKSETVLYILQVNNVTL